MGIRPHVVKSRLNGSVQFLVDAARAAPHVGSMDTHAINLDESHLPPKRRQVLEAAVELFMAHGYANVSMDAVARAAGVSKATLYAYHASKAALFASIVGDACRRNTLVAENFPEAVSDIDAALRAVGGRLLRFLLQPRTLAVYRVAVAESARVPELGAAFWAAGPQAFLDRFALWLAAQSAAGHLHVPDPGVAAEQFSALLRGSLFMRVTLALPPAPTDADIDATVAAAVDTFMRAFRPA
jgi:TetR/AcrR family transcriptional repressor of mexJK operon